MLCCERHPNPVAIFSRVQIWWCNQRASLKATFGCVQSDHTVDMLVLDDYGVADISCLVVCDC